jgi:hypothetical protein
VASLPNVSSLPTLVGVGEGRSILGRSFQSFVEGAQLAHVKTGGALWCGHGPRTRTRSPTPAPHSTGNMQSVSNTKPSTSPGSLGLIRFGGHLSYGGYDVQTDGRHRKAARPAPVHG